MGAFAKAEDGAIMVEFALLFPVFVILLVGVVDVATATHRQMQLEGAVGVGLQLAVARQPTAGPLTEIRDVVMATAAASGRSAGQEVTVTRFCERFDGSPVDCALDVDERAMFLSIELAETWSLFAPYPMIGSAIRLSAGNTVRVR